MNARVLVDGVATGLVAVHDRGCAYGDGVFETLLVADGKMPWWDAHLARLQRGCKRLRIEAPDANLLQAEAQALAAGEARAVLKLVVTRGAAGRGYAVPSVAAPTRILSLHPAPEASPDAHERGIRLHSCHTRLAIQPQLAGIKHLNRLEQVLARSEWDDPGIAEGLMQDMEDRVVCATAANLFVARRGRWLTPDLARCGVEGICRAWVIANFAVEVGELTLDGLLDGDELFLASSVRGILPVARLGGRRWDVGPMTRIVQQALWEQVPALDPRRSAAR